MLFVQFGINSTRDVWKFCHIGLAPVAHSILAKFANINITRTINPKLYSQSHDNLITSTYREEFHLSFVFRPTRFYSIFL